MLNTSVSALVAYDQTLLEIGSKNTYAGNPEAKHEKRSIGMLHYNRVSVIRSLSS
jgi:hypothetical protein